MTSEKSVERLSLYRRLLYRLQDEGETKLFSHQLATMADVSSAQVRRDIMGIGYAGSPNYGYSTDKLIESIGDALNAPGGQQVALVGVGNLGRALLAFFSGRRPKLQVVAAFDSNPNRVDRVIHGCRCYPLGRLEEVVHSEGITVGVLAIPSGAAQKVADKMYDAGIRGILNFAPVRLAVAKDMYVEGLDVTMALEKVAYFARHQNEE